MSLTLEAIGRLTPKERECLRLVNENRSSKAVARHLGISHTSVDTHVRRALAKLNLHDRYEAAQLLSRLERGEGLPDAAPAAGSAATPAFQWRDVMFHLQAAAPPLERLGLRQRLTLVAAAAIVMSLVFGIVLNATRTL